MKIGDLVQTTEEAEICGIGLVIKEESKDPLTINVCWWIFFPKWNRIILQWDCELEVISEDR